MIIYVSMTQLNIFPTLDNIFYVSTCRSTVSRITTEIHAELTGYYYEIRSSVPKLIWL
jgi:hypothetical protein